MHFNIFIHHWLNPESQLHLNLPEATDCNVLAVLLKFQFQGAVFAAGRVTCDII